MTAYIAGPIMGKDGYKSDFLAVESRLWGDGYNVLNPTKLPADLPPEAYMPICISMVEQADAVFLLEGWDRSLEAVAEAMYAARQGKSLYLAHGSKLVWDPEIHWFKEA